MSSCIRGEDFVQRLMYGDIPPLKATKELDAMSLSEVRASIEMVRQFKSLLIAFTRNEDDKALIRAAYNRFSDVLQDKAMNLAVAETIMTKQSGGRRQHHHLRAFLRFLQGGRR